MVKSSIKVSRLAGMAAEIRPYIDPTASLKARSSVIVARDHRRGSCDQLGNPDTWNNRMA